MKGKLIVIEGACDGIGKSTQYNLLKEYFIHNGCDVISHHFPTYNSKQGALVESYLKGELGSPSDLSPYYVNSLYAIDRKITWDKELYKAYNSGKIVILDRYTTSSLIYQSALINDISEKKSFINFVEDYEYNKLNIKKPDLVIFLNADFNTVTNLRKNRVDNDGIKNDIHERNIEFMKKVYDNSLFVSKYLNFKEIKCDENGSMRSIEDIHNDIINIVKKI